MIESLSVRFYPGYPVVIAKSKFKVAVSLCVIFVLICVGVGYLVYAFNSPWHGFTRGNPLQSR